MDNLRLFRCTNCHAAYICPDSCPALHCLQCEMDTLEQVNPFTLERRSGAKEHHSA